MFNYEYINELKEFGTCLYYDNEVLQELVVKNKEVSLAIYEASLNGEVNSYSMLCKFIGAEENKGLVWAVGLMSNIGSYKVFDSHKETNVYYSNLKRKAPENFKLIYEGNKNVG